MMKSDDGMLLHTFPARTMDDNHISGIIQEELQHRVADAEGRMTKGKERKEREKQEE